MLIINFCNFLQYVSLFSLDFRYVYKFFVMIERNLILLELSVVKYKQNMLE